MAQLVEWLLPAPRIQSLDNFIYYHLHSNCVEKTKIKKKRLGMGRLKNKKRTFFNNNASIAT